MYLENVKIKNKFFNKLIKLFNNFDLDIILFNRSLLCAETVSLLSHDNYDDFILDKRILKKEKLLMKIKKLYDYRLNNNVLRIFYGKFQVNLILVDFDCLNFTYNGFILKVNDFKRLKQVNILKNSYLMPKYPKKIFDKIFYPKHIEIFLAPLFDKNKNLFLKLKNFFLCFTYLIIFSKSYSRYELNFKISELYKLNIYNMVISAINKFKKKKIFELKENEFNKLQFDPIEFNHHFRSYHYKLITNNFKYLKIKDIIKFLKKNNLKSFPNRIVETIINKPVDEPIYLNKKFWRTGNNFYINPILFGFKKKVIAYEKVNDYLKLNKRPAVYTKSYYQKLKDMDDFEIKKTLMQSPIAINDRGFLSGRHRVAAMIGRLIRGEKYFPFYVYKI